MADLREVRCSTDGEPGGNGRGFAGHSLSTAGGESVAARKRGGFGPRDKWGHCQCAACTEFNRARWRACNDRPSKVAWSSANKAKSAGYSAAWISRNPEKRRELERSWKLRNPDRVARYSAVAGAKWAKNNKGKKAAITQKRRAAKHARTPSWADLMAIRELYERAAEMTRRTGVPHEVDHVIPLQGRTVSGLHVLDNLRIITRSANRQKQNRLEDDLCAF